MSSDAALAVLPRSRRRALVRETAGFAAGGRDAGIGAQPPAAVPAVRASGAGPAGPAYGPSGRSRYLDAYWRRWRLHVEVDGAWHLDARAWWADMRRQNEVWIAGDRVLRFPAWALNEPERVTTQLRAALVAAGWRP